MQTESDFEYTIKILIIGDSSIGKTNMIYRFIDNKFSQVYMVATGMDLKTTTIDVKGKK